MTQNLDDVVNENGKPTGDAVRDNCNKLIDFIIAGTVPFEYGLTRCFLGQAQYAGIVGPETSIQQLATALGIEAYQADTLCFAASEYGRGPWHDNPEAVSPRNRIYLGKDEAIAIIEKIRDGAPYPWW